MTTPTTVTVSHELGQEEARKRIREGFAKLNGQIAGGLVASFDQQWESDDQLAFRAKSMGQTMTGKIDVFPEHVRIEMELPPLLAAAAEKIKGRLADKAKLLLEKK